MCKKFRKMTTLEIVWSYVSFYLMGVGVLVTLLAVIIVVAPTTAAFFSEKVNSVVGSLILADYDPNMKDVVHNATWGCGSDCNCTIASLYEWQKENIEYTPIIGGQPASETLRRGYGDCFDQSILFLSLTNTAMCDCWIVVDSEENHAYNVCDANGVKWRVDLAQRRFEKIG